MPTVDLKTRPTASIDTATARHHTSALSQFKRAKTMSSSTHSFQPDERNASILININGDLVPRDQAVVSVFDSGFILGDGIWEGLRAHRGTIPFLNQHLKR